MFTLDDVIVDRIQYGLAMDTQDKTLLYTLTQLQDAQVEITGQSKEAKDKDGTLIKKFWKSKNGTFTAKNAMLNLNVVGAMSGSGKITATTDKKIIMPGIKTIKGGEKGTLTGYISGSAKCHTLANNGTMGPVRTDFTVADTGVFTAPTDEGKYIVEYNREVASGYKIYNRADKFPQTIRLILKVLAIEPCTPGVLRAAYLVLPSFQVSPEITMQMTTDATLDYKGDLQVNYCGDEKTLYEFYFAEDDVEEED